MPGKFEICARRGMLPSGRLLETGGDVLGGVLVSEDGAMLGIISRVRAG